ncbi:hypothetical protein PFISCL1PPCAC_17129 [Pristionchus fissidentatus]|uniref:G protein-coupled receptor n=1 Tax=Pristionchus fissidentatus TaxID=1538716 RepID=A0AAV5W4A7_9BILA|nr:hypothetical protein PFISCL1PPCAC_17129 [Pristionchus fissidentatus]
MAKVRIFGCHVTIIGLIFDSINLILFVVLLGGTTFVNFQCQNRNLTEHKELECYNLAIGVTVGSVVLSLVEIISTGLLISVVVNEGGKILIVPLVMSYFNIAIALVFTIISMLDACFGSRQIGEYIWKTFGDPVAVSQGRDDDAILAISISLCCLLVVSLAYCIFNAVVHTLIWLYYAKKKRQADEYSETASQVSIIATFSMNMLYEEWRKKEERTITSIAEEDENVDDEHKEETGLW